MKKKKGKHVSNHKGFWSTLYIEITQSQNIYQSHKLEKTWKISWRVCIIRMFFNQYKYKMI